VRRHTWTEGEDNTLKHSFQLHGAGAKDWVAIAALVPGRTKKQCLNRWHIALTPSNALKADVWDNDLKLRYALEKHSDKDWAAVAELGLGRTKN
jgi:hypothetical protein